MKAGFGGLDQKALFLSAIKKHFSLLRFLLLREML